MQRYFIRLAYNGFRYHGWQIQENARSVQQVITGAFRVIWKEEINLVGCGRTDTGVHARDYFAHFELEGLKDRDELDDWIFRLNRYLDDDIVILDIFPVDPELHARFSAVSRTYQYFIHTRKDPFLNEISWFVPQSVDVALMNEGAKMLSGIMDFTSFARIHTDVKSNICTVMYARWEKSGHQLIFTITADRFLRNMVRAVVGTLLELGQQKITLEDLREIIEGKNRSLAGESVPAKGLFLTGVEYPKEG